MNECNFYRGKLIDNREWVYGFYATDYPNSDREMIIAHDVHGEFGGLFYSTVDPETVGRYTGRKDKKGVKAFEDDKFHKIYSDDWDAVFTIEWNDELLAWVANNGIGEPELLSDVWDDTCEIIGNIHDKAQKIMRKKYSWNFNKDAEVWCNNDFDTIEECIADAKALAEEEGINTEVVYIGENVPFDFTVDSTYILERLEEQAYDFSEQGGDWDAFNPEKQEELTELNEKLTVVVKEWMEKHGYTPCYYVIMNISEHCLRE